METRQATVLTVLKNVGNEKESVIRKMLTGYAKRVQKILENHGYEVVVEDMPRIFHVKKSLGWFAIHFLDLMSIDGCYDGNPTVPSVGHGYIDDFINQQRFNRIPGKVVCITDVPAYTAGRESIPIEYCGPVTWLSYFNPKTSEMLTDDEINKLLDLGKLI